MIFIDFEEESIMVNYNLAEFKAWLEEDESRKDGLEWHRVFRNQIKSNENLQQLIEATGAFDSDWKYCRQVALKWKASVDERERERANWKEPN